MPQPSVTYRGKTYTMQPFSFELARLWSNWLTARVRHMIRTRPERFPPGAEAIVEARIARGEFGPRSPFLKRAMMTRDGLTTFYATLLAVPQREAAELMAACPDQLEELLYHTFQEHQRSTARN